MSLSNLGFALHLISTSAFLFFTIVQIATPLHVDQDFYIGLKTFVHHHGVTQVQCHGNAVYSGGYRGVFTGGIGKKSKVYSSMVIVPPLGMPHVGSIFHVGECAGIALAPRGN